MLLALCYLASSGCGIGSERKHPLELKVRDLEQEKAAVAADLEKCRIENEQLAEQIEAMAALPKEDRDNPYKLRSVKIGGFTNLYDKDGDGRREKFVVYLKPIDQDGNVVKAAGTVSVQLWNLDNPTDQALLGQWQVQPDELHRLWFDALVSTSYRLTFDVPVTVEVLAQPLTVRITFTDYLTGEIFRDQRVIQPRSE